MTGHGPDTGPGRSSSLPPASRLAAEGRGGRRRSGKRRGGKRRGGRPGVSIWAMVLFLLVFGGVGGYMFLQTYMAPPDYTGGGTGSVVVVVEKGASLSDIGARLEESGVVKSSRAFVSAASESSRATSIQPGHYELRRRMAARRALQLLLDPGARVQAKVVIPEGTRMAAIFSKVAKQTDISKDALRQAAKEPGKLGVPEYAKTVEGYLFPATYTVRPDDTARNLLRRMVDRYQQAAKQVDLVQRARQRNLTPHEAVTLASLVQGEARAKKSFRKVSAVVYNRLDKDMKLQFDSTVNYVTGKRTLQVSKKDTQVDSPYNTYQHPGLPPGPINVPGKAALQAALQPAQGDWLYFVTTNPEQGITKFTNKYKEFQKFKRQFERNTNSG